MGVVYASRLHLRSFITLLNDFLCQHRSMLNLMTSNEGKNNLNWPIIKIFPRSDERGPPGFCPK